jgi:hypothetical protein
VAAGHRKLAGGTGQQIAGRVHLDADDVSWLKERPPRFDITRPSRLSADPWEVMMPSVATVLGIAVSVVVAAATRWWLSGHVRKTLRCRGGAILYGPEVSAEEVRRLRHHLERVGFFRESQRSVGLEQAAGVYQFRIPCMEGVERDEDVVVRCGVVAAGLAHEVFPEALVEVHLCDKLFRTLHVVPHCGTYGERVRFHAAEVFYTPGVTEEDVMKLGTYLMWAEFFNDNPKLAQFNRIGDGLELRLEVKKESELGQDVLAEFRRMASDLSRHVFQESPVVVRPCEGVGKTLQTRVAEQAPQSAGGRQRVFTGQIFHTPRSGEPT